MISEKIIRIFGIVLIIAALLSNHMIIESYFSEDNQILLSTKAVIWLFQFILFVSGFVFIRHNKSLVNITWREILLLFSTIIICFAAMEGISYIVIKNWINYQDPRLKNSSLKIFTSDSEYLPFGTKKNYKQKFNRREFSIMIENNNIGIRESFDYTGSKIDIGFVGDSFTFGYGVNWGERYSDQLRNFLPGKTILNYTYANGYAPPHYYLYLKNNPELIPHILVLGLFSHNDLNEDIENSEFYFDSSGNLIKAESKFYINEEGELASFEKSYSVANLFRKFYLGKLILIAKGVIDGDYVSDLNKSSKISEFHKGIFYDVNYEGLEYIIDINDLILLHSGRLIVFLIPESYCVGNYDAVSPYKKLETKILRNNNMAEKSISNWLTERNIEVINPIEKFKSIERSGEHLYYKFDAHWNVKGHFEAAKIIYKYLAEIDQ